MVRLHRRRGEKNQRMPVTRPLPGTESRDGSSLFVVIHAIDPRVLIPRAGSPRLRRGCPVGRAGDGLGFWGWPRRAFLDAGRGWRKVVSWGSGSDPDGSSASVTHAPHSSCVYGRVCPGALWMEYRFGECRRPPGHRCLPCIQSQVHDICFAPRSCADSGQRLHAKF